MMVITGSSLVVILCVVFCMLAGLLTFDCLVFNVNQNIAIACGLLAVIVTGLICGWGYIILHLFGVL